MSTAKSIPKAVKISNSLRQAIRRGTWQAGDKLPTMRALAKQFEVTVVTVGRALEALEQQNLVQRVQGSGTFVADPGTSDQTTTVGATMPTRGHTFGHLFGALVDELAERGLDVLPADTTVTEIGPIAERRVSRILRPDLRGLVVDGMADFPFSLLTRRAAGLPQITFLHRFETKRTFARANRILSNYQLGGVLATQHLLERGAAKLALLSISENAAKRRLPDGGTGLVQQFQAGVRDALSEAGRSSRALKTIYDNADHTDEDLRRALEGGVDGIICLGDNRAARVYRVAEELGREVGKDLLVIGYYNTPWCAALAPALTSISIQEERLAARAAQAVKENWEAERVWIAPVVVERESTKG